MNKICLLAIPAALLLFSATSCKKKYTCRCYTTIDTNDITDYEVKASSKAEAEKNCPPVPVTAINVCKIQ